MTSKTVTVIKRNPQGAETWRYSGKVLEEGKTWIRIEALFNRDDTPFHGIVLKHGDRFVETYYSDHWYNLFEIHDRDSGDLKCWYCNVARPAEFCDGEISYVDLALDLLVFPDGKQLVLDEDEFAELNLDPAEQQKARLALRELQTRFERPIKS